ncbi:hypothetical protein HBI56_020780 [Parastagonospora nodorum]|uniref:Uncharacterized protein n=2 Tax=Phaeosphaeria nodorum (strain SN15 / ATCC MYA-4574 / FGSC 10173) TaxID=321614 RepID=A0A7U2F0E7_PHANO|nr:hypothetical protein SNOG_01322 [Parastagonospora nodorum SN15]KAH3908341.1 hypothetical protein HBH56_173750 [Parastagonospora nodorum]EAT90971.1 hypothetical protein SNOG_01322 [Parastagonospora nodorum SN15]KAH3926237.1 hypothetical protein HBH54_169350 [Parastagonospora nodorum]KAH3982059.1 hypothetical protein HBH52_074810 [Parastagonospora nodorum]KAH4007975.1 hypothetical protein HBI10_007770 [Parastagonospora nodorum]
MCYLMPRSPTLLAIPSLSLSAQSSPCPCRSQDPSPASNVNVARASPIWEPLMSREQLYHHTVLPRDVPGREDRNLYCAESELATRLTDAVKSLVPHAPLDDLPCIDAVRLALTTCGSINVDGKIDKTLLIKALQQMLLLVFKASLGTHPLPPMSVLLHGVTDAAPLDDLPCIDAVRLALTTCGSINVDGKMERSIRPYSSRHYNRQNEATGAISLSPWRDQRRSSTWTYRAHRRLALTTCGSINVDGKMERSIRPYSLRHYNRQNEATGAISLSPWRDQRRSSTRTYRAYRSYPPSPHGATNAAPLHGHTEPIGAIHPLLHGLTDSDDGRVRVQVFSRILL